MNSIDSDAMPVRIGMFCRNVPVARPGDQPGAQPDMRANCRVLALLYMPLGSPNHPPPFNLGVRDPATEVQSITIVDPKAAQRFLSVVHYN